MKLNIDFKTYKDKIFILPMPEFSWQKTNKIFMIKLAFLKWATKINFNF